jgi:hypothetical protein
MNKPQGPKRNGNPPRNPQAEALEKLFSAKNIPQSNGGDPDGKLMYSAAIDGLIMLGRLCPDFAVRRACLEYIAAEFGPPKPGSPSELESFKITLQREIERYSSPSSIESSDPLDNEAIELESETIPQTTTPD